MRATLIAVAVASLLAGCASSSPLPQVTPHRSPVKAAAKVPRTHHHTTLTGYTHREPVMPDAWVPEDDAAPTNGAAPTDGAAKEKCKPTEGAKDDCPVE